MSMFRALSLVREEGTDPIGECLCVYTCVHMCVCVCACVYSLWAGTVDLIPGEDLTHQLRHSPAWKGRKSPSGQCLSHNSQKTLCRSLGLSFPGIWGLLASSGSSVTAWEMRGASGEQMPPIPGSLSAVTELGLNGLQQKSRDLHLALLILQLLSFSNHTVEDSLSLLLSLSP